LTIDTQGNLYVADQYTHRIRKVTPGGFVTTVAGNSLGGTIDAIGTLASFNFPTGVTVDATGTIYVADNYNHRIRKIALNGQVTTLAGSGTAGFKDGTGPAAVFQNPQGITVDIHGNLYVSDTFNNRIRKVTPDGIVTTLAGSGNLAFADGSGTLASFAYPAGILMDNNANLLYLADTYTRRVRRIDMNGVVSTFAGNGVATFADGTGTSASFNVPLGIAMDTQGKIYVTERENNRLRQITPNRVVSTLAGNGGTTFAEGIGTAATFNSPFGVAVDAYGNLYVTDGANYRIRKIQ
jgi:sugar lactone lactonase YvrE